MVLDKSCVERILSERQGWLRTEELRLLINPFTLEALIGKNVEKNVFTNIGDFTILNSTLSNLETSLIQKLETKGGQDISTLTDIELAVLNELDNVEVVRGKAYLGKARVVTSHPYLDLLDENLFLPPAPEGNIEKELLREFVYQKLVVESDGIFFSIKAVEKAQEILSKLLNENSKDKNFKGITVSEFRVALDSTRKICS